MARSVEVPVALRSLPWQERVSKQGQRSLIRTIRANDARVLQAIEDAANAAEVLIKQLPGPNVGNTVRRAQYRQIRDAIKAIDKELWKQVEASTRASLSQVTQQAITENKQLLEYLMRAVPNNATILAQSFRSSALRSFQDVRSRILNEIKLSGKVYRNTALTTGKIDSIVNEGILLQRSAAEIASDVVGYINPDTPGGARYAAQRLGRTELNNAFHTTSIRSYQESPHVRGVQWELSGSHGLDDDCDELADTDEFDLGAGVYPPEDVPFKPHPQCFCYTTAITLTPEEFVDAIVTREIA